MTEHNRGATDTAAALFARLQPAVVAIDGPAASGKSTVGYRLAERVQFLFFDTGVLYRAITWVALDRGIAVDDENAVTALAQTVEIDVAAPGPAAEDGRLATVLVDGQDVTWLLRTPEVDQHVSQVSAYGDVRRALSLQQRRIGQRYGYGQGDKAGVVMVGRDIGTVIMPEAGLKIYMIASPEERARRRLLEQQAHGLAVTYDEILQDLIRRDRLDSERAYSPLRPADDALIIDTSLLTSDQVVERIIELAAERVAARE
jgi:cytidylate kinase